MTTLGRRVRAKLIPRQATFVSRTDLAGALVEVWCTSQTPLQPGDVVAVRVAGRGPGPTGEWRRYTVAESDGHRFRLLIQHNPGGAAAAFIDSVRPGDAVTIRGPEGAVLPPVGEGPLLVVSDVTGLATLAALTNEASRNGRAEQITVAVFSENRSIDSSVVRSCLGDPTGEFAVLRHLDDVARLVSEHAGTDDDNARLLAIGEHGLTAMAKSAARGAGRARTHISTRAYWRPGRRGLE
jgi:NADPH-dependent ferric siderophore reductase